MEQYNDLIEKLGISLPEECTPVNLDNDNSSLFYSLIQHISLKDNPDLAIPIKSSKTNYCDDYFYRRFVLPRAKANWHDDFILAIAAYIDHHMENRDEIIRITRDRIRKVGTNDQGVNEYLAIILVCNAAYHRGDKTLKQHMAAFFQDCQSKGIQLNCVKDHEDTVKRLIADVINKSKLVNPFRGLEYFDEGHKEYFFGRATLSDDLAKTVINNPITAIIGASGCGKSSLIFAGIIPTIPADKRGAVITIRLSKTSDGNLFEPLAEQIVEHLDAFEDEIDKVDKISKVVQNLEKDHSKLLRYLKQIRKKNNDKKTIIVIDQFEELNAQDVNEKTQILFVHLLVETVNRLKEFQAASFIIAFRKDYWGQIDDKFKTTELPRILNQYHKLIDFPNKGELKSIIEEPIHVINKKRAEYKLPPILPEPRLIEQILKDAVVLNHNLPLIEFALTELWTKQEENTLKFTSYIGIANSLTKHAEEVFLKLKPHEQRLAESIFVKLVHFGIDGAPDTKKLVKLADFTPQQQSVLRSLEVKADEINRSQRLIVFSGLKENNNDEMIELAHDKLIEEWPTLQKWLQLHRNLKTWKNGFDSLFKDWSRDRANTDLLLDQTRLIVALEQVSKAPTEFLTENELEYIETSKQFLTKQDEDKALKAKEEQERLKKEQKEKETRYKYITLASVIIALTFTLMGITAIHLKEEAQEKTTLVKTMAAEEFAKNGNHRKAALLALQNLRDYQSTEPPTELYQQKSLNVLRSLIGKNVETVRIPAITKELTRVAISSDKSVLALGDVNGTVSIWDWKNKILHNVLSLDSSPVMGFGFNADDTKLAIALYNGKNYIYEIGSDTLNFIGTTYAEHGWKETNFAFQHNYFLIYSDNSTVSHFTFFLKNNNGKYRKHRSWKTLSACFEIDYDTNSVIFADNSGVHRLDLNSGEVSTQLELDLGKNQLTKCMIKDRSLLINLSSGLVQVGNLEKMKSTAVLKTVKLNRTLETNVDFQSIFYDSGFSMFYYKDDIKNIVYSINSKTGELSLNNKLNDKISNENNLIKQKGLLAGNILPPSDSLNHITLYEIAGLPLKNGNRIMVRQHFNEEDILGYVLGDANFAIFPKMIFPENSITLNLNKTINNVSISGDFYRIAIIKPDNNIEIGQVNSASFSETILTSKVHGQLNSIQLNYDGSKVLVAYEDGYIAEIDTSTWEEKAILSSDYLDAEAIYSDDYLHALVGYRDLKYSHTKLLNVEIDTGLILNSSPFDINVAEELLYDYYRDLHSFWSGNISLLMDKNAEVKAMEEETRQNDVVTTSLSSDKKRYVATSFPEDQIETKCKITLGTTNKPEIEISSAYCPVYMMFSLDEKLLMTLDDVGNTRIYLSKSGELLNQFQIYFESGFEIAKFTSDSKLLVIQTRSNELNLYDAITGKLLFEYTTLKGDLKFLGVSKDSTRVAFVENNEKLMILPIQMIDYNQVVDYFRELDIPPLESSELDGLFYKALSN